MFRPKTQIGNFGRGGNTVDLDVACRVIPNCWFPGFAVNEFLTGMIYGCFFYKKKITLLRVIIARACITVFINLILTSLWLNMMYQSPLFTMVRLIKNVVMFPVDVALLYAALKGAERVRKAV